jgi:uncharacterized membrane protein YkoI
LQQISDLLALALGEAEMVTRPISAILLILTMTLTPASAEETLRPIRVGAELEYACLNQKERHALVESGSVIRLAAAMHAVRNIAPGTLLRARLCRRPEGLAYVLTLLAHDGKVTHVAVDAVKGTLGER